jgi:cytochrome c2
MEVEMNCVPTLAIAMLVLIGLTFHTTAESGDAMRGERVYRACVACHSLEPNRNMTGPSLAEVWNRKAGSLASFPRYSPALKSSRIVWTDATLDEWITIDCRCMKLYAGGPAYLERVLINAQIGGPLSGVIRTLI